MNIVGHCQLFVELLKLIALSVLLNLQAELAKCSVDEATRDAYYGKCERKPRFDKCVVDTPDGTLVSDFKGLLGGLCRAAATADHYKFASLLASDGWNDRGAYNGPSPT